MNDVRTKIGAGGRVIIPISFRNALHLNEGDDIILHFEDNEIHLTTPDHALFNLQERVKANLEKFSEHVSLVDELIAMRRVEAKHEQ